MSRRYSEKPPCECCKKPTDKVYGVFEKGVAVFVNGVENGILEVVACTRACAREISFGTQKACPKLPKGARIFELEED